MQNKKRKEVKKKIEMPPKKEILPASPFAKFYLTYKTAIVVAVAVAICFVVVNSQIKQMSHMMHSGDETGNIYVVRNIGTWGYPGLGAPENSPMFDKNAPHALYMDYTLESYLRYPAYFLSKYFGFEWRFISSLIYLYLICILLVIYFIKDKTNRVSAFSIAFLILLLAASKWESSTFHRVRYNPFTVMGIIVSFCTCTYLYLYNNRTWFIKYGLILLVGFLPFFFHMLNIYHFIFWVGFVTVDFIYKVYNKIKNSANGLAGFITNHKKTLIVLSAIILSAVAVFFAFILQPLNDFLVFSKLSVSEMLFKEENKPIVSVIYDLFIEKSILGVLVVFIPLVIVILNRRSIEKFNAGLLLLSAAFLVFAAFALYCWGGGKVISNTMSYLLFVHTVFLCFLAALLGTFMKVAVNKLPDFLFKEVILFLLISGFFCFAYKEKFKINETDADTTVEKLEQVKDIMKKYNNPVFVTDKVMWLYAYQPQVKAYFSRTYPDMEFKEINKIQNTETMRYYMDSSGYVCDWFGAIYVGRKTAFCKMLKDNEEELIYFFDIIPPAIDKDLINDIQNYVFKNPVSAKYLIASMCDTSDAYIRKIISEPNNKVATDEYINLDQRLLNKGKYQLCIDVSKKILSLDPVNLSAYINMSVSYANMKAWKEAKEACENALKIDPASEQAKRNMEYIKNNLRS